MTYELALHDGRILRTRISHPVDRTAYGPAMWRHMLQDQLDVTEDEFWACAQQCELPDRGASEPPCEALPADLVYLLIHRVGVGENAVAGMTKEEAVARLQKYWTDGS
ncbi:cytotoxic translational repressor of toxin-antitoxin stability system [Streptomyces sp. IBSBF 2953]|nr:cytotoxic translational repressor of toxin-antitoxin stability system [Streptomyces hayashii]